MQIDAYRINQRNIFTFILWFVKRFNSKCPDLILDKYFNVNISDLSISGDFLERTDKVTISNTSVTLMINYILKKIIKKAHIAKLIIVVVKDNLQTFMLLWT